MFGCLFHQNVSLLGVNFKKKFTDCGIDEEEKERKLKPVSEGRSGWKASATEVDLAF